MASKSKRERNSERKKNKKNREENSLRIASVAFSREKEKTDDIIKNLKKINKGQYKFTDFNGIKNSSSLIELIKLKDYDNQIFNLFFELIQKKCEKMLENEKIFKQILNISMLKDFFIRDVKTWKKKSYNPERQFSSLVRHLLCKYEVPEFMNEAWEGGIQLQQNDKYNLLGEKNTVFISDRIQWFLDIGNGKNIRHSQNLPIHFTKKMAHCFNEAPSHYTINQAIRYAEIKSKGGDNRIVETINQTFLGREFVNNDFWTTVIDFLIENPMIDPVKVGPMLDYIKFQKFEPRREFVDGRWVLLRAENQGFTIKGRNPNNILEQTEEWHERINAARQAAPGYNFQRKKTPSTWKGLPYLNFKYTEGTTNKITYEIIQLLSYEELSNEGSSMNHCVASYAYSCYSGRCGIFSLRKIEKHQLTRMVTIEVLNNGKIVQVRGKNNRLSEPKESNIIYRWVLQEGLLY